MYSAATGLAGAQGISVHRGWLLLFLIFTLVALSCSAGDRRLWLTELYMQHKESIPSAQRCSPASRPRLLCACAPRR